MGTTISLIPTRATPISCLGISAAINEKAISQGLSANLTSTLSTNLINSFTFGWNQIYANFGCTGTECAGQRHPRGGSVR